MCNRDGNSFVKCVGKLGYFANFRDMVEDHLAYASGITGLRLFQFRAVVVIVDGVQKRMCDFMVKRKMNEKGAFHNFQCKENVHPGGHHTYSALSFTQTDHCGQQMSYNPSVRRKNYRSMSSHYKNAGLA